ncbi:hypothetical protein [Naasia aerilata]|nr:hypothetical protein [Naasia aerilata]
MNTLAQSPPKTAGGAEATVGVGVGVGVGVAATAGASLAAGVA